MVCSSSSVLARLQLQLLVHILHHQVLTAFCRRSIPLEIFQMHAKGEILEAWNRVASNLLPSRRPAPPCDAKLVPNFTNPSQFVRFFWRFLRRSGARCFGLEQLPVSAGRTGTPKASFVSGFLVGIVCYCLGKFVNCFHCPTYTQSWQHGLL